MRRPRKAPAVVVSALLIAALAPFAQADAPTTYGIDVGIGESDNIKLSPTDPISQTLALAEGDFAIKKERSRFDVDATGNFAYVDYLQHAYTGQLTGRFDGLADFAILPRRLSWVLQEHFGQATLDPFTAATPTNLEDVNYLSTGPQLSLRLGGSGFLDLGARYARAQYQTSPFNSNREIANLALGHEFSARSRVSINGNTERVRFDDTAVNVDFNRSSAYGRYEIKGARTELAVNLGGTRVSQGGASISGGMGQIELSRLLSPSAKLTFTAGRELTDASSSFSNFQGGATGAISSAPAALTSNTYTSRYATVGWQYARDRTTLAVSDRWEKDSYQSQTQLDVTRNDAELNLERRLTREFSAQILGSFYDTKYPNADFSSNDSRFGAAVVWRTGRALEMRLRYERLTRSASGIGVGYHENLVFLMIGYRPRTADVPAAE